MDFDQVKFITKAKLGVDEWNEWVLSLKEQSPNQRIKVEFTSSYICDFLDFNGFEGYDFSLFHLSFKRIQFANLPAYDKATEVILLKNVRGLWALWIDECFGVIPSIWIENTEIGQIVVRGSRDSGGTSIKDITIKNCSMLTAGIHLDTASVGRLWLESCQFNDKIHMPSLQVKNVDFDNILFLNYSLFDSMTTFKNCIFNDCVQICHATFRGYVEFTNCDFLDRTDFQNTIFGVPPRFNGSSLNSQTLFPPEENFKVLNTKDKRFINVHIAAFQLLKTESSKLLDRRTQGMFFSLEQKYLLLSNRMNIFEKTLSLTYQVSSNYGRSIFRPIVGLVLVFILYTLLYATIKSETISWSLPFSEQIFTESLRVSLTSIFLPFKVILLKDVDISIVLLSISQSLASLGLVTLSLLALRWNFRRD